MGKALGRLGSVGPVLLPARRAAAVPGFALNLMGILLLSLILKHKSQLLLALLFLSQVNLFLRAAQAAGHLWGCFVCWARRAWLHLGESAFLHGGGGQWHINKCQHQCEVKLYCQKHPSVTDCTQLLQKRAVEIPGNVWGFPASPQPSVGSHRDVSIWRTFRAAPCTCRMSPEPTGLLQGPTSFCWALSSKRCFPLTSQFSAI